MLPMVILSGVNKLVYAYGNYRHVLMIGLAVSIPRTQHYFLLVPMYGGAGSAASYTIGSVIGCLVSLAMSRKIGMCVFWKDLGIIFIIPTTLAFAFNYLEINFILGILTTVVLSYVILLKLHVVTRSDVQVSLDILPESLSKQLIKLVNKFRI